MRACECCQVARETPDYRLFCPSCLWCGARIIQRIGQWPMLSHNEIRQRRRAALADWVAYGHNEETIRELVKGPRCIQPLEVITQTGRAASTASERPSQKKRR